VPGGIVTQRALVVEDSPTQAAELRILLEEAGYAVAVAANGLDGLAAAHGVKPDVIITDVQMPEMDGYAFCAAVKAAPALKGVPVILSHDPLGHGRHHPCPRVRG
jgi:CheY-like chemotaxis protein